MAALMSTIRDKGFQNWLKSALAVVFAKQGLEEFVITELTQLQKDLLTSIFTKEGVSPNTTCNSCTTENILLCSTSNFCPRGRKCDLHDFFLPDKIPKGICPTSVCHHLRDGIRREHRYNKPSWKNTDATGWCKDAFQIGKCYMPPDGYFDVQTITDTDFNGILSIIINNRRFESKMDTSLDEEQNVCTEARNVGRLVRHTGDMSISDEDLARTIDVLTDLLTDTKCLASDPKARECVDKLSQLKANTLTITTTDIMTILDEEFKAVVTKQQENALQAISTHREEEKKRLLDNVRGSMANMKTVTLNHLDQIVTSKMNEIRQVAEKEKKEISEISAKGKQEIEKEIRKVKGQTQEKDETDTVSKQSELERNLRDDLISFYRKYHSTIPVSPIVEEHDVPLADFYVQPPISSVDIQKKFGRIQESRARKKVHSCSDIFLQTDGKLYKDIYITAKAGVGKTSFVKRICMIWCQAHGPVKEMENKFKPEEVDVMKSFTFMFFISLRDVDTSLCNVDEMIFSQLIKSLARYRRYSEILLEDILQERDCLILLDGLDEWTHPDTCMSGRRSEHGLPHRPAWDKCTILTTTRPWKLDVLMLSSNQIDRHIEINELDQSSSKQLISNAVELLNKRSLSQQFKTAEGFQTTLSSAVLGSVQYIPYILLQMICIWFDGESIGKSKCEIYSNILELTLSRGLMKLGKRQWSSMRTRNLDDERVQIPKCLTSNELCKGHYDLILSLGQIAFDTLFCLKKESTVVFDLHRVLEVIPEYSFQFCLQLGLLSQNKDCQQVASRRRTFSFQHKSVQECMAALYIQSHIDSKMVRERLLSVCSSLTAILEYSNTFVFLGGFCSSACGKALQLLQEKVSDDEALILYRESLLIKEYGFTEFWRIKERIRAFQFMQTDIVQEIRSSGQTDFPLFVEDVIIDSTTDKASEALLEILIDQNKDNIKSLYVRDVRCTDDFTNILQTTGLQKLHSLLKLVIIAVPKTDDLLTLLANSLRTLKCLRLSFVDFRDNLYYPNDTTLTPETVLKLSNMDCLMALMLSNIQLTHGDVQMLFKTLSQRTQMTEVGLYHVTCSDHIEECGGEYLDFSQHQNIKTLNLDKIPVTELRVNSVSLNECLIGEDRSDVFPPWFDCLKNAPNLHSLWFRRMTPVLLENLVLKLQQLVQLKKFGIEITDLGDRPLSLCPGINIDSVYFYKVAMSATTLKRFAESTTALPQAVKITLEWCKVTPVVEYYEVKDYIRMSPKYIVTVDGPNFRHLDQFEFETVV